MYIRWVLINAGRNSSINYTIKQVAEKLGVSVSKLRDDYKEGLMPFVDKRENETRVFKDEDFGGIQMISYMKSSRMPIKEIKRFMDMCLVGDDTLEERLQFFLLS